MAFVIKVIRLTKQCLISSFACKYIYDGKNLFRIVDFTKKFYFFISCKKLYEGANCEIEIMTSILYDIDEIPSK